MSVNSGPYGRVAPVVPPLKGAFPLDYGKECHVEMLDYMWCLNENKFKNEVCRQRARAYFQCRMDRGLMDKDEWYKLGYKDNEPDEPTLSPTKSNN